MKIRIIAAATLIVAGACATADVADYAKTPPPPGADVYRCVNESGSPYFRRFGPNLMHVWRGDHWDPNACEEAGNVCMVDPEEGLLVYERTTILPSSGMRVDMLDIFNPKAMTNLSTVAMLGEVLTPTRDSCALHQ